jgi:hypothetical protein
MSTLDDTQPSKGLFYTGWVLTGLVGVFLLFGGVNAWIASPQVVAGTAKFGFPPGFLHILAPIEFLCGLIYLIPRTAVFGALLITAYCGGAVVTHLHASDPAWYGAIIFCIIAWAGLLMRRPLLAKLIL